MSVRAAILIIGDEVLSGRTQDVNVRTIARFLGGHGVDLAEVRIVHDDIAAIVAAVNELRRAYNYVFSTGGLGPTHDDKTADAMAAAFGVKIDVRDDARALLAAHYKDRASLNESRLRMARIPDTATLIANPVSKAPGFQIGNVFVLAGVPSIVQGMLQDVGHRIVGGAIVHSRTVRAKGVPEGDIADDLGALEAKAQGVVIFGSYPWFTQEGYGVHLVARSSDAQALAQAVEDLAALIRARGVVPEEVTDAS
jgi:molybdenum cofactor synthesis domain-containing protein